MTPKTLKQLVHHVLATQFNGLQKDLAETLDVDATHIGRLVKGTTTTLSVEAALRLARACDLDPDLVLQLAGKDDVANDIRRLYGKAAAVRGVLAADERDWLAAYRALGADHRKALLNLARSLPKLLKD